MSFRTSAWSVRVCATVLISALWCGVAHAPPPPPPNPAILERSCGKADSVSLAPSVPVTVEQLSPQTMGMSDGKIGKLNWLWGARVSASAFRHRRLQGLEFSPAFGLIAVTNEKEWLTFDLRGDLSKIRSVGMTPMVGAPGEPGDLVNESMDIASVSFPLQHTTRVYALGICGFSAGAAEGITESRQLNDEFRAAAPPMPHYRLVGLSEADRFVPDYRPGVSDRYLAWSADGDGAGAFVQEMSSASQPRYKAEILAHLPQRVTAVAAIYSAQTRKVIVYLASDEAPNGSFDLFAFSVG
jgi:hypothetical protein